MRLPAQRPARPPDFRTTAHRLALLRLLEAREASREFEQDIWQFAVQLPELRTQQIPDTVLRELVAEGLVAHAEETTKRSSARRAVIQVPHQKFSEESCFILTEAGLLVALAWVGGKTSGTAGGLANATLDQGLLLVVPAYVKCADGRRELRWQDHLVKCYKAPAQNQELVLAAFEEQDWARCILDPISPKTGSNSKQRLHDTIDRLNRDHIEPWLRFHGDGSGRAVNWEVLVKIAKSAPIVRR